LFVITFAHRSPVVQRIACRRAAITRIEITATERPTFAAFSWPGVGQ